MKLQAELELNSVGREAILEFLDSTPECSILDGEIGRSGEYDRGDWQLTRVQLNALWGDSELPMTRLRESSGFSRDDLREFAESIPAQGVYIFMELELSRPSSEFAKETWLMIPNRLIASWEVESIVAEEDRN